ncbi:MAG TPA: DUF2141 domain-containing protein [Reyranella sp.]|jgi:uncharacterized protein (DUF2141 family)|nr:DUF2141 domain-containing protein [Reyranella sp.]
MTKLMGLLAAALAVAMASAASAQTANTITVPVEGLRNDLGVVRCGLYASAKGFREPGKEFKGVTAAISGGKATCVFADVPPGTYAVAVFHAEHNEARLETGMFGKPKQGYGFSRDAKGSMGPPSFDAAAYAYPGGPSVWPVHIQY